MEAFTPAGFAFFTFVIIVSYAVRGGAGFGGVTVPLLALVMSLKTIVPMVTFLGIISSCFILRGNLHHIRWPALWRVMPFCLVGVLTGLYFFKTLDSAALARSLGVFVIGYGLYSLCMTWRTAAKLKIPMWLAIPAAGSAAGFVGTIFGSMAGMFFAIYLDLLKLDKSGFRSTVAAILLSLGICRGLGYASVGSYDRAALLACLVAVPAMLIGVWIGNHIHANLNDVAFKRFVAIILIGSGLPLLFR